MSRFFVSGFFALWMLTNASARAQSIPSYCEFQSHDALELLQTESSLIRKIESCLKIHTFQQTAQYFQKTFSQSDGRYVYFQNSTDGDPLYSERRFSSSDGGFYYLRKASDNDKTFFSIREFTNSDGKFTYYRRQKDDNLTFSSVREFSQGNSRFIYFRKYADNSKTLFSTKSFDDGGERIVYFRAGKDDATLIASIKGSTFRNANRAAIPPLEFSVRLKTHFWDPLITELIFPALGAIDSGF
ncbi:MAG: hypothetical protein K2X47_20090 [Bdellovibrionales bacterium]|nr:hypothetical protein [Bdellovibrionales bacterium]